MTGRIARPLSLALLSASLTLPLTAQPASVTHGHPVSSLLAQIWERLAAPVVALFAADETDGRSIWEPEGLMSGASDDTENDGRGVWDPNGRSSRKCGPGASLGSFLSSIVRLRGKQR